MISFAQDDINVARIRNKMHMTQKEFAERFGIPMKTLQEWEYGRREPAGTAKILIRLIDKEPDAILRVLDPEYKPRARSIARRKHLLAVLRLASAMWNPVKRMYPKGFKQELREDVAEIRASLLDYKDHTFDYNVPAEINTIKIARSLGLNQEEFASRFHIPLETLVAWETGRAVPDDAMKAYIITIDKQPNAVLAALS